MKTRSRLTWIAFLYVASLPLIAVPGRGGQGGLLGIFCLITVPIVCFHPSWWANPLFFYAWYSLRTGKAKRAFICGLVASVLAVGFSLSYRFENFAPGYGFWTASIITLTWASMVEMNRSDQHFKPGKVTQLDDF